MKKRSFPTYIIAALTALSLVCYAYLNAAAYDQQQPTDSLSTEGSRLNEDMKDTKVCMPDMGLLKRMVNVTKIVLPKE